MSKVKLKFNNKHSAVLKSDNRSGRELYSKIAMGEGKRKELKKTLNVENERGEITISEELTFNNGKQSCMG